MSSNGFSCAIDIRPGWSAANLALAILPVLAGLLGLAVAELPPALALPAGAIGVLAGGWSAWRATPWSRDFVRQLASAGPGEWRVSTARQGWESARLTASWVCADGFALGLAFEATGGRRLYVILFRSSVAGQDWRRLLVRILQD